MKFIATTDGYLNADYVKRFLIVDAKIGIQDEAGAIYFDEEEFTTDEEAQKYLDELIEELEKE